MARSTTKTLLGSDDTLLSMSDDGSLISYVETSAQGQTLDVLDVNSGQSQLISTLNFGASVDPAHLPITVGGVLSANGQYLLFDNGAGFFIKDLQDGSAPRNVTPQAPATDAIYPQAISDDGLTIVYGDESIQYGAVTGADEVVDNLASGSQQRFLDGDKAAGTDVTLTPDARYLSYWAGGFEVQDLAAGTTFTPPVFSTGGFVSNNGRYTVYSASGDSSGRPSSSTGNSQVFVHDADAIIGVPDQLVSENANEQIGNGQSYVFGLSGDGRHVLFESDATNLVSGVADGKTSLYVKNLDSGVISIVKLDIAPQGSEVEGVAISDDGSRIIYTDPDGGIVSTQYAAPTLTVSPVSGDDLVNGKEPTVTVSGTSDAIGETVHLSLEGTTVTGSAVVQANGAWSTLVFIGPPQPDGVHTIDATVTDALTTTTAHPFTVDTTPPSLTLDAVAGDNFVNAAELSSIEIDGAASDGSTNPDGTSDEFGQVVKVSFDNHLIGTTQVTPNGTWQLRYNGEALAEGQHEIEFSVADQAGNVTSHASYFVVDTIPPKIAITSIGDNDVVNLDAYRHGTLVEGTSDEIGGTVDVSVNGRESTATVAPDGSWKTTAFFAGAPAGSDAVTATIADEAGNIGSDTKKALVDSGIIDVSKPANGPSSDAAYFFAPTVSGDGQVVAFNGSDAALVPNDDTSDVYDVYVKDIQTGSVNLLSKMLDGSPSDGYSRNPVVSQDGRFVAFTSDATDIVAGDTNGPADVTVDGVTYHESGDDVFVTDLSTGVTERADTTSAGGQIDGPEAAVSDEAPAISANGRYVAFTAVTTGLVPGVSGQQIYLKDLKTGDVSLVSASTSGQALDGLNGFPSMSSDGRYVAFVSTAPGGHTDPTRPFAYYDSDDFFLASGVAEDTGDDVFVKDTQTGTLTLVSSTASGDSGNAPSTTPVISPDGRYVAFFSYATDLGSADTLLSAPPAPTYYLPFQLVVRDLTTGKFLDIPYTEGSNGLNNGVAAGVSFSADDQFMTFNTEATVDPNAPPGTYGYVYNLQTGALTTSTQGFVTAISADGKTVTFESEYPLTNDAGGGENIYQEQLQPDSMTIAPITGDNVLSSTEIGASTPVTGMSDAIGGAVALYVDGTDVGTAVVHADGTWGTTFDARALVDGEHQLQATVTDGSGFTASAGTLLTVQLAQGGRVLDGYLAGATIFTDANGNGVLDSGEGSTVTDATGGFSVPAGTGPLVATGGTDTMTGLAFAGRLTAPASSTVISPLTTLVEAVVEASGNASAAGLASAQAAVEAALHLPNVDLTRFDPVAAILAPSADSAAVADAAAIFEAGSMVASLMRLIDAAGGSGAAALTAVAGAIAAGGSVDLTDPATLIDQGGLPAGAATVLLQMATSTRDAVDAQLAGDPAPLAILQDIAGGGIVLQRDAVADIVSANGDDAAAGQAFNVASLIGPADADAADNIAQSGIACYCRGTRLLTEGGEVAVEHLALGDRVVTASGATRPIVWLGHRRLDLTRHPDPQAVWPICVAAGAFGEGLPTRELWMSPGHNVFVEGVLIAVSRLVNGVTIVQRPVERVIYWHVELDAHDIILAEGLPAESYLDTGNRTAFTNGGTFLDLHPDFSPKHWADTCVPLVLDGPEVTRAKQMLLARAATLGHVTTAEADPHVIADGQRIEPMMLGETRLGFTLPPGCADIRLLSRTFVPAEALAASSDKRALGLCVQRLQIDGEDVGLDDPSLDVGGWHAVERRPDQADQRWTIGVTPVPPKTQLIVIDLAGRGYYWQKPRDNVVAFADRVRQPAFG